jgi:N-acetylglucosaminyldiphosphoundecaprenol N-acetyl-beta-D-mannosaminyltransferase
MCLLDFKQLLYTENLDAIHSGRLLINTLNAHSYVTANCNNSFKNALLQSHVLLPDGVSIVMAMKMLTGEKLKKIAGDDLFKWEMQRLNRTGSRCFFLGSLSQTLQEISDRCKVQYPNVSVGFYSPPFKATFDEDDTESMLEAINTFSPEVLFIGMTAPKQEKWAAENFERINAKHVCSIGAVFDFYAGHPKRAPSWIINLGMEWFYRLVREPRRMWRRYLIGNIKFISLILGEKLKHADRTEVPLANPELLPSIETSGLDKEKIFSVEFKRHKLEVASGA